MALDWYSVTLQALQDLWRGFLVFLPTLLGAMVVFIIGWFIAVGVGKLIAGILNKLRFNQLFEKGGWKRALEKAEFKVNASEFIGAIVKWVLIIVFLLAAVEILGFDEFAVFLGSVLGYLGKVIVAALIFVVTVIVVDIVVKIVVAAAEGARFSASHLAGEIVRWSIWVFAALAILYQLGVAQPLIETLFTGLVAVLAISAGIAFGLGGKEVAAELLQGLKKRLKG
jgi:small-conductance mechanosensitive channel